MSSWVLNMPLQHIFTLSAKICCFLQIWSHLLSKSLMGNLIFCSVYVFSYSHNQSFRESSLEFLFFLVSMVGVVCYFELSDRCQEFITQIQRTCENREPLGWNHLRSHIDISNESKRVASLLNFQKQKLLEFLNAVNTSTK